MEIEAYKVPVLSGLQGLCKFAKNVYLNFKNMKTQVWNKRFKGTYKLGATIKKFKGFFAILSHLCTKGALKEFFLELLTEIVAS